MVVVPWLNSLTVSPDMLLDATLEENDNPAPPARQHASDPEPRPSGEDTPCPQLIPVDDTDYLALQTPGSPGTSIPEAPGIPETLSSQGDVLDREDDGCQTYSLKTRSEGQAGSRLPRRTAEQKSMTIFTHVPGGSTSCPPNWLRSDTSQSDHNAATKSGSISPDKSEHPTASTSSPQKPIDDDLPAQSVENKGGPETVTSQLRPDSLPQPEDPPVFEDPDPNRGQRGFRLDPIPQPIWTDDSQPILLDISIDAWLSIEITRLLGEHSATDMGDQSRYKSSFGVDGCQDEYAKYDRLVREVRARLLLTLINPNDLCRKQAYNALFSPTDSPGGAAVDPRSILDYQAIRATVRYMMPREMQSHPAVERWFGPLTPEIIDLWDCIQALKAVVGQIQAKSRGKWLTLVYSQKFEIVT